MKSGNPKALQEGDAFSLNSEFQSASKRIIIPVPHVEETYSKEKVSEDRSHAIEACIVRVMKSRKKLEHTQLQQEVMK